VLAVNSTSKAYGLPGLRLGWVVGPRDVIAQMWAWQDYITICTTKLANELATVALSPHVRARILERTRTYVRRGFANVERWAAGRDDVEIMAPDAAAICFAKYRHAIGSTELVMRLIKEQSTFVAPGDLFAWMATCASASACRTTTSTRACGASGSCSTRWSRRAVRAAAARPRRRQGDELAEADTLGDASGVGFAEGRP